MRSITLSWWVTYAWKVCLIFSFWQPHLFASQFWLFIIIVAKTFLLGSLNRILILMFFRTFLNLMFNFCPNVKQCRSVEGGGGKDFFKKGWFFKEKRYIGTQSTFEWHFFLISTVFIYIVFFWILKHSLGLFDKLVSFLIWIQKTLTTFYVSSCRVFIIWIICMFMINIIHCISGSINT